MGLQLKLNKCRSIALIPRVFLLCSGLSMRYLTVASQNYGDDSMVNKSPSKKPLTDFKKEVGMGSEKQVDCLSWEAILLNISVSTGTKLSSVSSQDSWLCLLCGAE